MSDHPVVPPIAAGHDSALLERMTDAFIALDTDWRVIYLNGAAVQLNGRPREQTVGRSHWDEWPHTVGSEVERQYRLAMRTQKPVHFEHHYMMPGRDFWHAVHAYPDAHGLSIFFRDITVQKRTDDLAKLLATASARFVSTVDLRSMMRVVSELAIPLVGDWACAYLVGDGYQVTNVDFAAGDAEQLTLLKQVVGQLPRSATDARLPWTQAMHCGEAVLAAVDADFHSTLPTQELRDFFTALAPRTLLCVPLLARGRTIGGITFGRAQSSRSHDDQDVAAAREVALPAGLALDTTRLYEAQRRATADAEDARKRAEDANVSKVAFLRALSHELRTPLNAIGGYVQLLRMGARGELSPAVLQDLERIERNQTYISRMINDVLHFARLEAGRVEISMRAVSVAKLLSDLEDFVAPQVDAEKRRLDVRPAPRAAMVWADEDKARQILVNLISNALKHTNSPASIEVFCEPEGEGSWRIRVRDTGPGIPAESQQSVFLPFVQAARALNRPVDGLGLGLAIARDLARRMEGDLTLESQPGAGATFSLSLIRRG